MPNCSSSKDFVIRNEVIVLIFTNALVQQNTELRFCNPVYRISNLMESISETPIGSTNFSKDENSPNGLDRANMLYVILFANLCSDKNP